MAENNIAGIWLTPELRTTVEQNVALAKRLYGSTYKTYVEKEVNPTETIQYIEEISDGLRYMLHPNSIKPLVSSTNTPEQLMRTSILFSSRYAKKITPYMPDRLIDTVLKFENFHNGIGDMLTAAWDTETLELTDANGKLHSMVMEFGFAYKTIGNKQFPKTTGLLNPNAASDALVSSSLIGITDKELLDAMKDIAVQVDQKKPLTKQQRLVFDFVSRLGDEGTIISYDKNENWRANVDKLTTKARGEYENVKNYLRGIGIFENLGQRQLVTENGVSYNRAQMLMVQNLALLGSDDVDLVIGKNTVGFDMPRTQRDVLGVDTIYSRKYQELTGSANTFTQDVIGKTADLDEWRKHISRSTQAAFDRTIFSGANARMLETKGFGKQENWMKALGFTDLVAHAAYGDAINLLRFSTAEGAASDALSIMIKDLKRASTKQGAQLNALAELDGVTLEGSLFQATTNGSMQSINKYQGYAAGIVTSANGDMYFSNNTTWKQGENAYQRSQTPGRFTPGLWNKGMTYEYETAELIEADKIKDPLIKDNIRFNGENVLHIRMSMYKGRDGSFGRTARGEQKIDLFVAESMAPQFLADNFGMVRGKKGDNFVMTPFGRNRLKEMVVGNSYGAREKGESSMLTFMRMNAQIMRDSAERSLNKFSQTTINQAIRYRNLAKNGVFAEGSGNRYYQIYQAVLSDLNDASGHFKAVKAIAGNDETAQNEAVKLAQGFLFDNGINPNYMDNVRIIATKMQEGSVLEQTNQIIVQAAKNVGIDINDYRNTKASAAAMKNIAAYLRDNVRSGYLGLMNRAEDQRGMFYIPLPGLNLTQQIGTVVGEEKPKVLGIDLNNVNKTLGSVMSVMNVPKHLREDNVRTRSAVIEMLHHIANSEIGGMRVYKNKDQWSLLSNRINSMIMDEEHPINQRNAEDIMNQIIGFLQNIRSHTPTAGIRTTEYNETLQSFLLKKHDIPEELKKKAMDIATTTLKSFKEHTGEFGNESTLASLITEAITQNSKIDAYPSGYTSYTSRLLSANRQRNIKAAKYYSESMVDAVRRCGGKIRVSAGHQIEVSWGDDVWENIMDRVVQLNTSGQGLNYFELGAKGTLYSSSPIARFDREDMFGIRIGSALELATDKTRGKNLEAITRDLEAGKSGERTFYDRFLKPINEDIRRQQLAGTSTALDYQREMTLQLETLFYAKDLDKRLPIWKKAYEHDAEIIEQLGHLDRFTKQVLEKKVPVEQARQFMQDIAAMSIFTGSNAITHLVEEQSWVQLTTDYKKSSSGLDAGMNTIPNAFSTLSDPGKQMPMYENSATYYVARDNAIETYGIFGNETGEKRSLKGFNIAFGPRYATVTQNELASIQDKSGIRMVNALQVPIVETNALVKEEILRQIENLDINAGLNDQMFDLSASQIERIKSGRTAYLKRAQHVISGRLNTTEGGGLYNGYLTDLLDTSWATQIIKLNGREVDFGRERLNQAFREQAGVWFDGDGKVHYGKGMFRGYDKTIASFKSRYGSTEDIREKAKNPSIVRVEYMSKENKGLLTAEEVNEAVRKKLKLEKGQQIGREQFDAAVKELFDEVIVAHNIYETDYKKMLFDREKHLGTSSTAFLGSLMHNESLYDQLKADGLTFDQIDAELKNNPELAETLLYDMLHTKTIDRATKKAGTDWRGSVALSADSYEAIASLDFSHPIWRNAKEENVIHDITEQYLKVVHPEFFDRSEEEIANAIESYSGSARSFFERTMRSYRHSINAPLYEVTHGGLVYGASMSDRAKHKDVSMLVDNTVDFIQRNLFDAASNDKNKAIDKLEETVAIFNQFNAITGDNDKPINLIMHNGVPTLLMPDESISIHLDRIQKGLEANGYDINAWKESLNGMRDFQNGVISWHIGTYQQLLDDTQSLKSLDITEREMSRFSSRVWTKDIADKIQEDLKSNWKNKTFTSKYLLATDMYQRADNQQILGEELIDYMFRESAFASFKDNSYGKEKTFQYGTSTKAAVQYDPNKVIEVDKYRSEKTKALIENAKKYANIGDYDPYISQEFADKFYAAASVESAARYNKYEDRIGMANAIINDWGMNKTDTAYFDLRRFSEGYTEFNPKNIQIMSKDSNSILRRNILWNMTDESIGLTSDVLGQHALVAVPGAIPKDFESMDETIKAAATAPHKAMDRVYDARTKVEEAYAANPFSDVYKEAVSGYIEAIENLETTIANAAAGKSKNDYVNQITRFKTPGSVSGKVNVTDTTVLKVGSKDFEALLGNKTYMGESLKDLASKGTGINYMIISPQDMELMGFNDEYFSRVGISKDAWMKKAGTEGVAGVGHRWPSIYWGSNMAVQVYVDDAVNKGMIRMDSITAAFMKADSDGDRAQLFMLGATQKNGKWVDELSLSMFNDMDEKTKALITKINFNGEAIRMADSYVKGHTDIMLAQKAFYNEMIKQDDDLAKTVQKAFSKFTDKVDHVDLSGNEYFSYSNTVLEPAERQRVSDAFLGVRDHLVDALERSSNGKELTSEIEKLKSAQTGSEAFEMFKGLISGKDNRALKQEVWENLGASQEIVNKAYKDAFKLTDADTAFLQRVAKGGAGVIDNPFTAADLLRREGQALNVLNAKQSFAMDIVREHIQEDFLTPKQMSAENARLMKDLNRVSELYGDIFGNKATKGTKTELVELLMRHRRETSARYQPGGLMSEFLTNGEVDDRKIIQEAVDATEMLAKMMNNRAALETKGFSGEQIKYYGNLLSTTQNMVRLAKMHTDNIIWAQRTMGSVTQNAINEYNKTAAPVAKQLADFARNEGPQAIESLRGQAGIVERVMQSAGSGKWSRNAIALAGAILFTGFVGGNPATPSGREAEQQNDYQEENPPVPISLADPSLSASGRKQPGYVININAQTQKDKDYASRVITQAVTRNYQNTNVNVSMNVNQQPGNISGKEIADYIRLAF